LSSAGLHARVRVRVRVRVGLGLGARVACVAIETGSMTEFIAASFSLGTPSLTWSGLGSGLGLGPG
jgi:hypothetical protein